MPTNVALTGLAKDLAARAETGKPVRIGLVGAGEMGTDIVSRVAHMRGIEIGAISELNPQAAGRSVTTDQTATLRARWLEWPTPACCQLDFEEAEPAVAPRVVRLRLRGVSLPIRPAYASAAIANALGITTTRLNQLVRTALAKLAAQPEARELFELLLSR